MNFQLVNELHYSLDELEYMIPWEREIYITMLMNGLEEKRLKAETQGM